eukprot:g4227.t1
MTSLQSTESLPESEQRKKQLFNQIRNECSRTIGDGDADNLKSSAPSSTVGNNQPGGNATGANGLHVLSQEAFDEVVQENIEDLEMDPEEALADAIEQFEAQSDRVDLSHVVKQVGGLKAPKYSMILEALENLEGLETIDEVKGHDGGANDGITEEDSAQLALQLTKLKTLLQSIRTGSPVTPPSQKKTEDTEDTQAEGNGEEEDTLDDLAERRLFARGNNAITTVLEQVRILRDDHPYDDESSVNDETVKTIKSLLLQNYLTSYAILRELFAPRMVPQNTNSKKLVAGPSLGRLTPDGLKLLMNSLADLIQSFCNGVTVVPLSSENNNENNLEIFTSTVEQGILLLVALGRRNELTKRDMFVNGAQTKILVPSLQYCSTIVSSATSGTDASSLTALKSKSKLLSASMRLLRLFLTDDDYVHVGGAESAQIYQRAQQLVGLNRMRTGFSKENGSIFPSMHKCLTNHLKTGSTTNSEETTKGASDANIRAREECTHILSALRLLLVNDDICKAATFAGLLNTIQLLWTNFREVTSKSGAAGGAGPLCGAICRICYKLSNNDDNKRTLFEKNMHSIPLLCLDRYEEWSKSERLKMASSSTTTSSSSEYSTLVGALQMLANMALRQTNTSAAFVTKGEIFVRLSLLLTKLYSINLEKTILATPRSQATIPKNVIAVVHWSSIVLKNIFNRNPQFISSAKDAGVDSILEKIIQKVGWKGTDAMKEALKKMKDQ